MKQKKFGPVPLLTNRSWVKFVLVISISYLTISGSTLYFIYKNNLSTIEKVLKDVVIRQKSLINTLTINGKSQQEIIQFFGQLKKDYYDIGESGEFVIAKRYGTGILFLVSGADTTFFIDQSDEMYGRPMYEALQNKAGFIKAKDYRGDNVFAAYSYVPSAGLGIVVKIPVLEVNKSFYKALLISTILFLIFLPGSIHVFLRLANPIIRSTFDNELRLKAIFKDTQAGYFFIDSDGFLQNVNKAWLELYKYTSPDEVIGKHFVQVQQLDDIEGAKEFVDGIMKGKPEYMSGDFSRKCKDGTFGYHSFSAHPVYKEDKCIGIEGFIIDITQLKETEKELLKAKNEAEESSFKFRNLFYSMQEGVYLHEMVYGEDGRAVNYRIIDANPVTESILNIGVGDAIGKLATELYKTSEAPFLDKYAKVVETSEPTNFEVYFAPMGKHFLISAFSPAKGQFATVFMDITDSKNYENELAAQNEEYAALNEELHQANEQIENDKAKIAESENRLKLKLEYLLSPENTLDDLFLTDIIDLELLQTIQDKFAKVTGIASVITDPNGVPITQPSNFSGVCKLVRETEKGKANCHLSDRLIGSRAGIEKRVVYEQCHSCGFIDAGAPIIIGGKQLGIWMIGQGNIGKVNRESIIAYACEIGAAPEMMLAEYERMPNMDIRQFESITDFLWILAREISQLAYNNIKLAKNIEEHKIYEAQIRKTQKIAEAHQEQASKLLKAVESSSASIVITDKYGNIEYANPFFSVLTGYSEIEYLGNNPRFLKSNLYPKEFYEELWNTINAGNTWEGEFCNKKKNGELYWENAIISPIINDNGEIINFVAVKNDITDRKNADAKLHKWGNIFKNARLGITVGSIGSDLFEVYNPAFAEIHGYTGDELIGKNVLTVFAPEAWPHVPVNIRLAHEKGHHIWESVHIRKDGTRFPVLIDITAVKDENDHLLYRVINVQDISERKKFEQELIKAKERAEESDRLKTAFIQNLSHEIRTPMNAIMGFSELMGMNFGNKEKLDKYSKVINVRCNNLLHIIDDLLDVARIESGLVKVYIQKFDLLGLLDELRMTFELLYSHKINRSILFRCNLPETQSKVRINSDKKMLNQILTNLLNNAFKFTEKGSIEFGYKYQPDNSLIFYVSDTGIGIPDDKRELIFNRFAQLHDENRFAYGGNGLGLSIVKGLVELLNGKIWIESAPNKGSTFFFTVNT